jgi:hypothetical protein
VLSAGVAAFSYRYFGDLSDKAPTPHRVEIRALVLRRILRGEAGGKPVGSTVKFVMVSGSSPFALLATTAS